MSRVEHYPHLSKSFIRDELREKIRFISKNSRRQKSEEITAQVLKTHIFKRAENILLYCSTKEEVQTDQLIKQALRVGKAVCLPKVHVRSRKLEVYRVVDLKGDLVEGYKGILEPRAFKKNLHQFRDIDLIIVPGLGFTRSGKRLGRGGGFYDKLLGSATKQYKMGIAFKEQLCPKIPVEIHDVKVDRVITD